MYKSSFSPVYARPHVERVYQSFEAAGYMLNQFGNIASDFAILSQQNDQQTLARVLSRMQDLPEDSTKGKSVREICQELRSRYVQTPAELDRFEQYVIDKALDYYKRIQSDAAPTEAGVTAPVEGSLAA